MAYIVAVAKRKDDIWIYRIDIVRDVESVWLVGKMKKILRYTRLNDR